MKYTARHIRRFLEQGKIDGDLWKLHFPNILDSMVPSCGDCEDFRNHLCNGGKDPVECFLAINPTDEGEGTGEAHGKKKPAGQRWNRNPKGQKIPANANTMLDQSKM